MGLMFHLSAVAAALLGRDGDSIELFRKSFQASTNFGLPRDEAKDFPNLDDVVPGEQAKILAARLRTDTNERLDRLIMDLEGDGGPKCEDHERAICELGLLLGLNASRPEKEHGEGPDVAWSGTTKVHDNELFASLELKTQKTGTYRKNDDIAQLTCPHGSYQQLC